MGTLTAGIIVVVALVVLLVLKKRKQGPKKEKGVAVPISDPQEISTLKKNFTAPRGKLTNSQLIQLAQQQQGHKIPPAKAAALMPQKDEASEKEHLPLRLPQDPLKAELAPQTVMPAAEMKPDVRPSEAIAENLKAAKWQKMQETIERLEQENKKLRESLELGASGSKEVASQVAQSQTDTQALAVENFELKRRIDEERSRYDELGKKFALFKSEFDHLKSLEWAKEETLQEQILKLKEENTEMAKTKEIMERRKAEFESLQDIKRSKDAELQKLQDELNGLKSGNITLLSQLKESQQKAAQLKEEMEVAKLTLEQKLSDATDRLISLQNARENVKERDLNAEEKGILEQLRQENEKLLKTSGSMGEEFTKLKDMNEQLREREKILQYELTKSRAQSIGLEKICEDFKEQIETMSKVPNEG